MSAEQALQELPFIIVHPYWSTLITSIFAYLILIGVLFIVNKLLHNNESIEHTRFNIFDVVVTIFMAIIIYSVSLFLVVVSATIISHRYTDQISNLRQAPVKTLSTKKTAIIGARSQGYSDITIQGLFYVSGNSKDTTSYRYVTKNTKGYQVHTLTDVYGDINPNDIFIKQADKPQLVVTKHEYANKDVRRVLTNFSQYKDTWTTYTFEVPNPKVISDFNFN